MLRGFKLKHWCQTCTDTQVRHTHTQWMKPGIRCQKFVKYKWILHFFFFFFFQFCSVDSYVTGLLDMPNFVKTHLDSYTRDYGACCSFSDIQHWRLLFQEKLDMCHYRLLKLRWNWVCIVYLWTTVFFISLFISVLSIIVGLCYIPDMGNNVPSGEY